MNCAHKLLSRVRIAGLATGARRLKAHYGGSSVRRLFLLPLTGLLLVPVASAASQASEHKEPPLPAKLEERIPVAPLGYRPPGQLYMLARMSFNSLDFVDSNRLLFTFHDSELLTRTNDPPTDDDQMIRATVLGLPDGRVLASSDWRMHDRSRYLWPLGNGRFLVRQGSAFSIADASLSLERWLTFPDHLVAAEVSPDGHLLVSETQYERHTPEEHKKLLNESDSAGIPPPPEDVLISLIDLDSKATLGRLRVESPVVVPVVRSGYVAPEKNKEDDYLLRFVGFSGHETTLGEVASTCTPGEVFLNEKTLMTESCGPNTPDIYLDTWTIDGKKLWNGRRDGHAIWPIFAFAQNGSRFAVELLRVLRPINLDDSLTEEDVKEQMVEVFDVSTGAPLLTVNASPVLTAGQNFALSPDGSHLAVLRDGAIEVYAVPPAPAGK